MSILDLSKRSKAALSADVTAIVARVRDPARQKERAYFRPTAIAVFALVCAGRESELATADELAALRAAHQRWQEFQTQLATIGHDAAGKQAKAARAAYVADPNNKSFQTLRAAELTKPELADHFREMRVAVKTAMSKHCHSTIALAVPVLARALVMTEAESASVALAETKLAERYGVPFAPSPTLAGLTALGMSIETTIFSAVQGPGVRIGVAALLSGILKL